MTKGRTKNRAELLQDFPWLARRFGGTEYLSPQYYSALLKEYRFDGKSDLQLLNGFVASAFNKFPLRTLELGCGAGRASEAFLGSFSRRKGTFELLDQSAQMLDAAMQKYGLHTDFKYIHSDIIDYLRTAADQFDFVFSLWAFSHSVHQTLHALGEKKGSGLVAGAIERLCSSILKKNGLWFLIHFDALSEEQKISLSIRRSRYPFFRTGEQSPSKRIIDSVLNKLVKRRMIEYSVVRHRGELIEFRTLSEALEVFFNFHMECEFNDSIEISRFIARIKDRLDAVKRRRGKLAVRPNCFVYAVRKVSEDGE